jgi:hypothetical protein
MTRIIFSLLVGIASLFSGTALAQNGVALAKDAPDSHIVVPGDTLWDISARFLQQPWRWPEVWRMNREQIRNPHLIYPGQVILLDRSGPWLTIGRRVGAARDAGRVPSTKLYPQVYTDTLDNAIPSIPLQVIGPFLTRPLVIEQARIDGAPTIIATETNRVLTGAGDTIFAKNVREDVTVWQILRPARPLEDPVTHEVIGYEAAHLGSARVIEQGQPSTLEILSAVEEIEVGDLMVPSEQPSIFAYAPHAPFGLVEARVMSIHRGVTETGRLNVVSINAGRNQDLEPGHVLTLFRNRGVAEYKGDDGKESFHLPEKRYGTAVVFRVFDRIAYALIMDSDGPVTIGDAVRAP